MLLRSASKNLQKETTTTVVDHDIFVGHVTAQRKLSSSTDNLANRLSRFVKSTDSKNHQKESARQGAPASPAANLGARISKSIYDLTSVERLKRWKSKLPSGKIFSSNNNGKILPHDDSTSAAHSENNSNGIGKNYSLRRQKSTSQENQNNKINNNNCKNNNNNNLYVLNASTPSISSSASFTVDRFGESLSRLSPPTRSTNGQNLKTGVEHSDENQKLSQKIDKLNDTKIKLVELVATLTGGNDSHGLNNIVKIENHLDKSKNWPIYSTDDSNGDLYEELDFKHQSSLSPSPVKLAPSGQVLKEMSVLQRPSAFRPVPATRHRATVCYQKDTLISNNQKDTLISNNNNDQRLDGSKFAYDNCKLSSRQVSPPSPPPRLNKQQKQRQQEGDNFFTFSTIRDSETSSVRSDNTGLSMNPREKFSYPDQSSWKSDLSKDHQTGSGFYKSFVNNNQTVFGSANKIHTISKDSLSSNKTYQSNRYVPNVNNAYNVVNLPLSIADSGVSVQNYSTYSYSSRNSSGLSDAGLVEPDSSYKDKEAELQQLRQTMEQNEQVIVQVYQEKEEKWKNKLKQWTGRVEQSIEVEQKLMAQIQMLQDNQSGLQRTVQTLTLEKQGLQKKCKELEGELFQLKEQINEKRKHWEICKDCGKIFLPDNMSSDDYYRNDIRQRQAASSLDDTLSNKAPTVSEELRNEMDTLKNEVYSVKEILKKQVDKFQEERLAWEQEKQQILQYHKFLNDNYGWLVNNNVKLNSRNANSHINAKSNNGLNNN